MRDRAAQPGIPAGCPGSVLGAARPGRAGGWGGGGAGEAAGLGEAWLNPRCNLYLRAQLSGAPVG